MPVRSSGCNAFFSADFLSNIAKCEGTPAKPVTFSGSKALSLRDLLMDSKTAGSTMPQPATSIQRGAWPFTVSFTSISKLGSVDRKSVV